MSDRIAIEVATRNPSMGGSGVPIIVSSYEIVNHDLQLTRGEESWSIGLEDIPELVAALNAVLATHQARSPRCYDCTQAGLIGDARS